jgi:hypothetical protein
MTSELERADVCEDCGVLVRDATPEDAVAVAHVHIRS